MDFEIWAKTQEYQDPSAIEPIELKELHSHWIRARTSADAPRQEDFSIDAVKQFAGNIALVSLETGPKRARYMLVGQNLKRLLGKDPTGQTIEEVYPPDTAKEVYEAFGKTVHERDASFYQRSYVILGKRFGYYRLIMPMRLNDEEIRRLLIGIYPTDPRITDSEGWQAALKKFMLRKKEFEGMHPKKLGKVWESSLNN